MATVGDKIVEYVRQPCSTETSIGAAFVTGVIFSPWNSGLFWLIIFIIVYEIVILIITGAREECWNSFDRAAIIAASLLGWLVGRLLTSLPIDECGSVPSFLRGGGYVSDVQEEHRTCKMRMRSATIRYLYSRVSPV